MAASDGKSRRRSATERSRGLRASANRAPPHGGGASRGVLSSASDDDGGGSQARLREQQAQKNCASSKPKRNSVGPSKYELQGPTV